jgi:hypothetical protein
MKFLIALSVLASTTVFANEHEMPRRTIKCYEPAPQGQQGDIMFKLEQRGNGPILHLVYPFNQPLRLNEESGCLEHPGNPDLTPPARLSLCPTTGQRINGLVPVEATLGQEEDTVYCERKIERWFDSGDDLLTY